MNDWQETADDSPGVPIIDGDNHPWAGSGTGLRIVKKDTNDRTQMAEGQWRLRAGLQTPTEDFFVIHHYDTIGELSDDHLVEVRDTDGDARVLDVDTIRSSPAKEVAALTECAGMSRKYLPNPAPGAQLGHGAVGAATWKGTKLSALLPETDDPWTAAIVEGADGGTAQPENVTATYEKALPASKALDPDTIIAWEMNGEPLTHLHGAPFRLVVPGWYGTWWVKWVARITLVRDLYRGFWQGNRYVYKGPDFDAHDVVADVRPRSLVVEPASGDQIAPGPLTITMLAWSGGAPLASVDVSVDNGRTWVAAGPLEVSGRWTWSRWEVGVVVPSDSRSIIISCRATDEQGATQGWCSQPNELGYANNAIHTIEVAVER